MRYTRSVSSHPCNLARFNSTSCRTKFLESYVDITMATGRGRHCRMEISVFKPSCYAIDIGPNQLKIKKATGSRNARAMCHEVM